MTLHELSQVLEKRRSDLYHLLTICPGALEPEKQHQLFGAINELDLIRKTIDYLRLRELESGSVPVTLVPVSEEEESGMVTWLLAKIKK